MSDNVEISFNVYECSEFHTFGKAYTNIENVEKAVMVFSSIEDKSSVPGISINIHNKDYEEFMDVEYDIISGKRIDLDMLDYYPEVTSNAEAIVSIDTLLKMLPDAKINGSLDKWINDEVKELMKKKSVVTYANITDAVGNMGHRSDKKGVFDMENMNYGIDVENYALYLINRGLKVGSKIKRNYGSFKTGNQIFEVTEITNEIIKAKCIDVVKPSISQERQLKKLLSEEIIINISECGSFAKYIIEEAYHRANTKKTSR